MHNGKGKIHMANVSKKTVPTARIIRTQGASCLCLFT